MQKSISSSGNSSHTDIFTKSNGHKIVFVHFQRATRGGFICMSMLASACFYKKSHISHIFPILLINLISLHKYVHVDIYLIPFFLFLNESWLSLPVPSLTWRPLKTWKLSCASLTFKSGTKHAFRWRSSSTVGHCKLSVYHHLLDVWCIDLTPQGNEPLLYLCVFNLLHSAIQTLMIQTKKS